MNTIYIDNSALENLRYAIVKQAITDYDSSLKFVRQCPPNKRNNDNKMYIQAMKMKKECEDFFVSKWFSTLCDLDGKKLMDTVRKKYYNRPLRWGHDEDL